MVISETDPDSDAAFFDIKTVALYSEIQDMPIHHSSACIGSFKADFGLFQIYCLFHVQFELP